MNKAETSIFAIIILVALFFIVVWPFIQIWAINTLFKTAIEYTWLNWFCLIILNSSIGAASYKGNK